MGLSLGLLRRGDARAAWGYGLLHVVAAGVGGALVGGLLIGLAESFAAGYQENLLFLGRGFGEVAPYVVMIIVLLVRPSGLFGTKELTRV